MSECADFLAWLQAHPPLEGDLSTCHGFLPPARTPDALPPGYEPWDDTARALPELFFSNRTRRILDGMPVLSAAQDALPAEHLRRAAVVLSTLAHAYWRFGADSFYVERTSQVPGHLPAAILLPWREVSRRLGRVHPERPFQNFHDLFLHNHRLAPGVPEGSPALVENLVLMVPSFGNEAERIFYAAFIEMHAHCCPMAGALCTLEDAVREDRIDGVVDALAILRHVLQQASKVWAKIGARPGGPFFCDPVLWSKTVAILGVPPSMCPQGGTSGACAPVLHLMDAVLERQRHDTNYGRYLKEEAAPMVPASIREFARRAQGIGLMGYVGARRDAAGGAALDDALRSLVDAYAGPKGWLGRHVAKVFNYLCISTLTGRNASVSGHERYISRQTWESAAMDLDASRIERLAQCPFGDRERAGGSGCPAHAAPSRRSSVDAGIGARWIRRSELMRHIDEDDLWIAVDGTVYDLSAYVARHPGGAAILMAHAGRDAGAAFRQQGVHNSDAVRTLLSRFAIGRLEPLPMSAGVGEVERVSAFLSLLLQGRQATLLQYAHPMGGDTRLKLRSDEHAHLQLWREILPAALAQLSDGMAERSMAMASGHLVVGHAQRLPTCDEHGGPPRPSQHRAMVLRSSLLRLRDLHLLDDLLMHGRSALAGLEDGAEAVLEPLVRASAAAVERYCGSMARDAVEGHSSGGTTLGLAGSPR